MYLLLYLSVSASSALLKQRSLIFGRNQVSCDAAHQEISLIQYASPNAVSFGKGVGVIISAHRRAEMYCRVTLPDWSSLGFFFFPLFPQRARERIYENVKLEIRRCISLIRVEHISPCYMVLHVLKDESSSVPSELN